MAAPEGIEFADKHWDLLKYLRDKFFGNNEHQPNTRTIVKAMSERWSEAVDQKRLYDLIPGDPSKQAGRIAVSRKASVKAGTDAKVRVPLPAAPPVLGVSTKAGAHLASQRATMSNRGASGNLIFF